MGLTDRIPGPRSGYRWISSKSQTMQIVVLVISLVLFISLGSIPRPDERTAGSALITVIAFLAMIFAILALIALVYPWLVQTTRSVRVGVFVASVVAYVVLARVGDLGILDTGLSFIVMGVAVMALWSLVRDIRQGRREESTAG